MNFVISLISDKERRQHIYNEFTEKNVSFEFFDAVTPNTLEQYQKKLNINFKNSNLGLGERACFLSHIAVWSKALELGLPYVTVFEDDIFLGNNATDFLNSYDWIPSECEIMKLEFFQKNVVMGFSRKKLPYQRECRVLYTKHLGTAGYIISIQGINLLLNFIRNSNKMVPIDRFMFDAYISSSGSDVYQMVPALVIQTKIKGENVFYSNLDDERARKKLSTAPTINSKKVKMDLRDKFKKEMNRILNNLRKLIIRMEYK